MKELVNYTFERTTWWEGHLLKCIQWQLRTSKLTRIPSSHINTQQITTAVLGAVLAAKEKATAVLVTKRNSAMITKLLMWLNIIIETYQLHIWYSPRWLPRTCTLQSHPRSKTVWQFLKARLDRSNLSCKASSFIIKLATRQQHWTFQATTTLLAITTICKIVPIISTWSIRTTPSQPRGSIWLRAISTIPHLQAQPSITVAMRFIISRITAWWGTILTIAA